MNCLVHSSRYIRRLARGARVDPRSSARENAVAARDDPRSAARVPREIRGGRAPDEDGQAGLGGVREGAEVPPGGPRGREGLVRLPAPRGVALGPVPGADEAAGHALQGARGAGADGRPPHGHGGHRLPRPHPRGGGAGRADAQAGPVPAGPVRLHEQGLGPPGQAARAGARVGVRARGVPRPRVQPRFRVRRPRETRGAI